jgi:hypothetical protein
MDLQQQIAAIKSALGALDVAVAHAESALRGASDIDDIRSLTSALVDLRSERARLQAQLDNLEAAKVEALGPDKAPAPKPDDPRDKKVETLQKQLEGTLEDRTVVNATLKLAAGVHKRAKTLRKLVSS